MSDHLEPGTLLKSRYQIEAHIGGGGMGTVYRATDTQTGGLVALKNQDELDVFDNEADIQGRIEHRSLPEIKDKFTTEHGAFLVMTYIQGTPLDKLIKRGVDLDTAIFFADQLLDAVIYLHNREIIHRDIKPANVLCTEDGRLYLVDFGLSKTDETRIHASTLAYAPLEQQNNEKTDERSDIFSTGGTIYHLLTGKFPADAQKRATAVAQGHNDPLIPIHQLHSAIPRPLSDALQKALALNPEERYASATEMRRAVCLERGRYRRTSEDLQWHEQTGAFTAVDLEFTFNKPVTIRYWNRAASPDAAGAEQTIQMLRQLPQDHRLPGINDTYDRGPYYCVVMEGKEGQRFDAILQAREATPKPTIRNWAEHLLGMLALLQRVGSPPLRWTLHPQYLMMSDDTIRLADYALAHSPERDDRYAAEEEFHSLRTEQSDMYRIAAIIYHLRGQAAPPSARFRRNEIDRGKSDPLTLDRTDSIQAWLAGALALEPAQRYADAATMQEALHAIPPEEWEPDVYEPTVRAEDSRWSHDEPPPPPPPGGSQRQPPWAMIGGIGALFVFLILGGWLFWSGGGNGAEPPEPTAENEPSTVAATTPSAPPSPPQPQYGMTAQEALEIIQENGELPIAVRFDAPPFAADPDWSSEQCDPTVADPAFNPEGFDIAITRQIGARLLGDEDAISLRCVPVEDRIDVLRENMVPIGITAFSDVSDRCNQVGCSIRYFQDGLGTLVREVSEIESICDLAGETVLVQEGTSAVDFEQEFKYQCPFQIDTVVRNIERAEAIELVAQGDFAAYVTNIEILQEIAEQEDALRVAEGEVGAENFVITVPQGEEGLLALIDETLQAMKADGTYDALYGATFGCAYTPTNIPYAEATTLPGLYQPSTIPENPCESPEPTAAPDAPTADAVPTETPAETYTVEQGNTLGGIARKEYGDFELWRCIAERNEIDDPDIISAGQELELPPEEECAREE
jgi:ABC-type amino acid transport substrate-binding protein/predicted Ser/Thr protein kinase